MLFRGSNPMGLAGIGLTCALLLTAAVGTAQVSGDLPSVPQPRPSPTLRLAQQAEATPPFAPSNAVSQKWNIHGQITETPQGDRPFRALYSGPNSLMNAGEIQETFTSDIYVGARLWHGAEIHADGLLWKGFG